MSFLDLIKTRRSIRQYAARPVSRQVIERCLEAARLAPSACNSQPWEFIVVDEPALKECLAKAAFGGAYSMNQFASKAPVLVAVVTQKSKVFARLGGFFRQVRYNLIDIGIAVEHFVLQAAEDGVGTCWLGWFAEKKAKRVLGITKDKKVDVLLSMGYPEGPLKEKLRKTMSQISVFNPSKDIVR
ncbi:MAG: nitroreductase family protein [Candidatus Omnitrophota bacterium]